MGKPQTSPDGSSAVRSLDSRDRPRPFGGLLRKPLGWRVTFSEDTVALLVGPEGCENYLRQASRHLITFAGQEEAPRSEILKRIYPR